MTLTLRLTPSPTLTQQAQQRQLEKLHQAEQLQAAQLQMLLQAQQNIPFPYPCP